MTAPDWLVQVLAEHLRTQHRRDRELRDGCTCGAPVSPTHIAHVAAVIWAEIERRMEGSYRSPNDPVYGLVPYPSPQRGTP